MGANSSLKPQVQTVLRCTRSRADSYLVLCRQNSARVCCSLYLQVYGVNELTLCLGTFWEQLLGQSTSTSGQELHTWSYRTSQRKKEVKKKSQRTRWNITWSTLNLKNLFDDAFTFSKVDLCLFVLLVCPKQDYHSDLPAWGWVAAAAGSVGRAPCGEDRCWLGVPAGVSSVALRCSLDCSTAAVRTDMTSGAPAEEDEEMGGEPSQRSLFCTAHNIITSWHFPNWAVLNGFIYRDPTFPPWTLGNRRNCFLTGRTLEQNRTQWWLAICHLYHHHSQISAAMVWPGGEWLHSFTHNNPLNHQTECTCRWCNVTTEVHAG